jgi:hypothetical protein
MHLRQEYPIVRVCEVLSYPRSQVYYEPQPATDESGIKAAIVKLPCVGFSSARGQILQYVLYSAGSLYSSAI